MHEPLFNTLHLQLFSKSSESSLIIMNSFCWERKQVIQTRNTEGSGVTPNKKLKLATEDGDFLIEQTLKDGSLLSTYNYRSAVVWNCTHIKVLAIMFSLRLCCLPTYEYWQAH